MTNGRWIELGALDDLPEGKPVLRKSATTADAADGTDATGPGAQRFVCVRLGDAVHALDDRCPHQGYPLSQGSVRDGVLTCEWHNWKFDLATGGCTFGGEPVRRYPTRVIDGKVHLDTSTDVGAERARFVAGIRAAMVDDAAARALREALRLGELTTGPSTHGLGALDAGFEVIARDGAERAEWGFDHGLALLSDACEWVSRGWIDGAEAFVATAIAIAEPSRHLAARPVVERRELDGMDDPTRVAGDLSSERRDDARARVRHLIETQGALATARSALVPWVSRRLLDYGHGAIFLAKAIELAARFPCAGDALMDAVTLGLAWATDETALPPFTATRDGVAAASELRFAGTPTSEIDRARYEHAVLEGEKSGVAATLGALREGVDPRVLLRATAHAAAVRLTRFDRAWERRADAEVGVLDVTHAITFAESAIALSAEQPPEIAACFAVVAAGFVGKLRRADRESDARDGATNVSGSLIDAVNARDADRAVAIGNTLDASARRVAYREIAPFAAFDAAVRPILYAHTVKTTEALRRLEESDPHADGVYLRACLSYVVPRRRERAFARTASIARRFLANGRPPVGLY